MEIEYEATFPNIDKEEIRKKLRSLKAKLIKKEFLQKRTVFHPPFDTGLEGGWLRVRDEGGKITMSLKIVKGNKIHDQKEICLGVSDFTEAQNFLIAIGCKRKAYQETKREIWRLDNVEVCIDEWPFLEPFVEIEGKSEKEVKKVAIKLGFDYNKAIFGDVSILYSKKYNVSEDIINNKTSKITFAQNPFLQKSKPKNL